MVRKPPSKPKREGERGEERRGGGGGGGGEGKRVRRERGNKDDYNLYID